MKINVNENDTPIEVESIGISAKCSDRCTTYLLNAVGDIEIESDGYVPEFFPETDGDYIELDIDIMTGKILNWVPPTKEQLEKWVVDNNDGS